MTNKRYTVIGIVIIVFLVGLFAWPKIMNPNRARIKEWNDKGVECLPLGHQNLAFHIHSNLQIFINDEPRDIPAQIGVVSQCMAEVHTHDTSGAIHIESTNPGREFTLEQFFKVWGEPLEKKGLTLEATLNNASLAAPHTLILKDQDSIVLRYAE